MADDLVPGMGEAPAGPRRVAVEKPRRRSLRWTLGILATLLVVLGGAGLGMLWLASNALDKATDGRGGSPIGVFVPVPLSNEDSGMVNVLIAGNSYDDPGHDGSALTDSILVANVNLETKKTALISIPRDLWVEHNGRTSKINAVYVYGGGGDAGLKALSDVIEKVTGLHIDQRVLVGYHAVRDVVDAVGGIDVEVGTAIGQPGSDTYIGRGVQHLDGEQTLTLARTRYGLAEGDFDRQANQRRIIAAIAEKAKTTPALANPAAVLAIFDTVSKNVHTDLNAGQLRRFYDLYKDGPSASVSIRGGDPALIVNYAAPDGSAALRPAAGLFEYGPIKEYVAGVVGA